MKEISDKFFSRMFLIGAIWNISFSVPGLLFPEFSINLTFGPDAIRVILDNFYTFWFYNFWWGSVLIFGIGYYIVSRDINKNHGIVIMAIIGKLVYFIFLNYLFIKDKATILASMGGFGDLLFTVLFVRFLLQKK